MRLRKGLLQRHQTYEEAPVVEESGEDEVMVEDQDEAHMEEYGDTTQFLDPEVPGPRLTEPGEEWADVVVLRLTEEFLPSRF